MDGEKDVWRSHGENAIRVILVIFILQVICQSSFQLEKGFERTKWGHHVQYLDRPNPEEEYVEAAVEGEADKVKWEEVKVEPNYAEKVINNNDEFLV